MPSSTSAAEPGPDAAAARRSCRASTTTRASPTSSAGRGDAPHRRADRRHARGLVPAAHPGGGGRARAGDLPGRAAARHREPDGREPRPDPGQLDQPRRERPPQPGPGGRVGRDQRAHLLRAHRGPRRVDGDAERRGRRLRHHVDLAALWTPVADPASWRARGLGYEVDDDGVAWLRLQRPEKRNAIDRPLRRRAARGVPRGDRGPGGGGGRAHRRRDAPSARAPT